MALTLKEQIKTLAYLASKPSLLSAYLSFGYGGYFKETGWERSFLKMAPVDKDGRPIPWTTYSYTAFIADRLKNDMTVFEYGSGASTAYYARKVKNLVTCEHDKTWFGMMKKNLPENAEIFFADENDYENAISGQSEKFEIIVVDAIRRVECMMKALPYLKENGILVLDDSEREEYTPGTEYMLRAGYKKIDFWGMAPGQRYNKCTTVFYKPDNCLGI